METNHMCRGKDICGRAWIVEPMPYVIRVSGTKRANKRMIYVPCDSWSFISSLVHLSLDHYVLNSYLWVSIHHTIKRSENIPFKASRKKGKMHDRKSKNCSFMENIDQFVWEEGADIIALGLADTHRWNLLARGNLKCKSH